MSASAQIAGPARHELRRPSAAEVASTEAMRSRSSRKLPPAARAAGGDFSEKRGTAWTAEEDAVLLEMRAARHPFAAIAARLGRSDVACDLRHLLLKRKAENAAAARPFVAAQRRCLCGCGRRFASSHAGERIAPECREVWQGRATGVTNDISLGTGASKRRPGAK